MRIAMLLVALAATLLSACAMYDTRLSSRSLRSADNQNLGTVFVWDNDVSAAVAYPPTTLRAADGNRQSGDTAICMQRAMTAGATAASGKLGVSDSILGLAKAPGAVTGDLGEAAVNLSKSVLALSVSTERTAFLDTGLFYLCQLAANGSLSNIHLAGAVTNLFNAAGKLEPSSAALTSLMAPPVKQTTPRDEAPNPSEPKSPQSASGTAEAARKDAEDAAKKKPK